jgi:hypothetical protein
MSKPVSDVEDIEARQRFFVSSWKRHSFPRVAFVALLTTSRQILALNPRVRTVASLTPTKVTNKVRAAR